jgi:GntR family transcriptional repressor for pyruvate dehydrogenase complex
VLDALRFELVGNELVDWHRATAHTPEFTELDDDEGVSVNCLSIGKRYIMAPRSDAPDIGLGRIKAQRAPDILSDELRGKILSGELPPGAMLPSERDLCEQTGLSRGSVRLALGKLEAEGMIVRRPGRDGGSFVQAAGESTLVRSLDVFIRGGRVRMLSVLEAREALEPACAALAAERHDDEALERIEEVGRAMAESYDDLARFLELNVEWHIAVARAGKNELLAAFLVAVSEAVRDATDIEELSSRSVLERVVKAHERVTQSIRARDASAAYRRMAQHVNAYRTEVLHHTDVERSLAIPERHS